MTSALMAALERRVATDGSRPLLTWYDLGDDGTGSDRVEFSSRTFANWVDKTVNLMASIGADEQPGVAMPLLLTNPGHWVGLVWSMAAWQIGGRVVAMPRVELKVVDIAVVGPANTHPVPGAETIACSLHPLGLGFAATPPAVTDYAEVLTQPDVHWTSPAPASEVAWRGVDPDQRLLGSDVDAVPGAPGRRVVRAAPDADPWHVVREALVAPVLGGGSTVLVVGRADADRLGAIAASEQAELG